MAQLLAGAARAGINTVDAKVNDPLFAKVLLLKSEETTAAIVSLDYICMGGGIGELSDGFFEMLKTRVQAMGIDHLICGTTHTHTPGTMYVTDASVAKGVCNAISRALDTLAPAKVGFGVGRDESFLINRTLTLKDGTAWSIRQAHPCPEDEEIAAVEEADADIQILRVDRLDGSPLCVLFTFGCHPLLGYAHNQPTANYPGVAERIIEEQTGAVAMLLQSSGGDVTEVSYKDYDTPKCCEGPGMTLALAVLKALRNVRWEEDPELKTALKQVDFPRRTDIPAVREQLLREREKMLESLGNCPLDFKTFLPLYIKYLTSPAYPLDHAYAYLKEEAMGRNQLRDQDAINRQNLQKYLENIRTMEKLSKLATTLETLQWHEAYNAASGQSHIRGEVAGLRLGEAVFLTAPVEPLSAIGRRVNSFTDRQLFFIGYANGYMHYGAPAESYNNGGYETIECMLAPGWQAEYEKAAKDILESL